MRNITTGTPVPKRDIEIKARGSGPVITYKMSPEEIATRYGPPGSLASKKEEKRMTETDRRIPTKEEYLQLRAQGLSIRKIEKQYNMATNTIYPYLRKWDLIGVDSEQAQLLLDEKAINNARPAAPTEPAVEEPAVEETPAEPPADVQGPAESPAIAEERLEVGAAPGQSARAIRIEAAGAAADIERELLALASYIQAMPRKALRLEIYLGEVAE